MKFASLEATRSVHEAAQRLPDTCREAVKESPDYKPGATNIDAVVSIAVQSLVLSDHWNGSEDRKVRIPVEERAFRAKGIAEGLGNVIGSFSPFSQLVLLPVAMATVERHAQQRSRFNGREADFTSEGR